MYCVAGKPLLNPSERGISKGECQRRNRALQVEAMARKESARKERAIRKGASAGTSQRTAGVSTERSKGQLILPTDGATGGMANAGQSGKAEEPARASSLEEGEVPQPEPGPVGRVEKERGAKVSSTLSGDRVEKARTAVAKGAPTTTKLSVGPSNLGPGASQQSKSSGAAALHPARQAPQPAALAGTPESAVAPRKQPHAASLPAAAESRPARQPASASRPSALSAEAPAPPKEMPPIPPPAAALQSADGRPTLTTAPAVSLQSKPQASGQSKSQAAVNASNSAQGQRQTKSQRMGETRSTSELQANKRPPSTQPVGKLHPAPATAQSTSQARFWTALAAKVCASGPLRQNVHVCLFLTKPTGIFM